MLYFRFVEGFTVHTEFSRMGWEEEGSPLEVGKAISLFPNTGLVAAVAAAPGLAGGGSGARKVVVV